MKKNQIMDYSKELALLAELLHHKLVTEREYQSIKRSLMNEYHILSDITAKGA